MNKVSISEAIRMSGVSRSHFYKKYIHTGLLSIIVENDKKQVDVSELIRVFGNIQLENNLQEQNNTVEYNQNTSDTKLIDLLEKQLAEAQIREKEAKEREIWLQKQIDEYKAMQTRFIEDKITKKKKKWIFF